MPPTFTGPRPFFSLEASSFFFKQFARPPDITYIATIGSQLNFRRVAARRMARNCVRINLLVAQIKTNGP